MKAILLEIRLRSMVISHHLSDNFLQGRPVPGIRFGIAPAYIFHYVCNPVMVVSVNQTPFFDHFKTKVLETG